MSKRSVMQMCERCEDAIHAVRNRITDDGTLVLTHSQAKEIQDPLLELLAATIDAERGDVKVKA